MSVNNFTIDQASAIMARNDAMTVHKIWNWTWPIMLSLSSISTVGNLIIFIIICTSAKFRRPVNYMIANLSLISIMFATSLVLRYLEDEYGVWSYSMLTCHLLGMLHRLPLTAEAFNVTMISFDRLHVVKEPLTPETKRGAFFKILLVWLLAIVIEVPRGFYHEYRPEMDRKYKCKKVLLFQHEYYHLAYILTHLIIVYILPTIIMFSELIKLRAHMAFLVLCHNPNDGNLKPRLRLLKTASYLIWFFIMIHLPLGLTHAFHEYPAELLPRWFSRILKLTRYHMYVFGTLHGHFYCILIFFSSYELRNYMKTFFAKIRARSSGAPCN